MKGVLFRPAKSVDIPFIRNSWLRSYRESPSTYGVGNDAYYTGHGCVVDRLLGEHGALIAVHEQVPDEILGWCCGYSGQSECDPLFVCHYVYVKSAYRNLGIARELLFGLGLRRPGTLILATHITYVNEALGKRYEILNDPYMLHRSNGDERRTS